MLLVVGGGLFGSMAARFARSRGVETLVFDPGLEGAASPAAAGLFKPEWFGKKYRQHFDHAVAWLEQIVDIRRVALTNDAGQQESFSFVPPSAVLEPNPIRQGVTAVGAGWLEAGGERYTGDIYVAAGIWCREFCPSLQVTGKAGAAFLFPGERPGRIQTISRSRQALAFVRDPGMTYFSDGTAEAEYTSEQERATLERAAALGLARPSGRLWGYRPYTPGGPVFRRLGDRLWLATGGRKLGTVFAASCARRLVEEELRR